MRVKEDKKPASTGIQTPKSDASSIASGSGTVSDNGTLASSSQPTIAVRADGEEAVAKNEATDDLDVETEAEEDEELLEEIEDNAHVVNGKPRMSDLIGKINSLVTTDLNDVTYLQNTLNLRESVQVRREHSDDCPIYSQRQPLFKSPLLLFFFTTYWVGGNGCTVAVTIMNDLYS